MAVCGLNGGDFGVGVIVLTRGVGDWVFGVRIGLFFQVARDGGVGDGRAPGDGRIVVGAAAGVPEAAWAEGSGGWAGRRGGFCHGCCGTPEIVKVPAGSIPLLMLFVSVEYIFYKRYNRGNRPLEGSN